MCSMYQVTRPIRGSTYPGYFLCMEHTTTNGMKKCSRSGEFDLTGSRVVEVHMYTVDPMANFEENVTTNCFKELRILLNYEQLARSSLLALSSII